MIGPALREHRIAPARGDLLNFAIAAAHLRQQDVSRIDANLESELVRVEDAPHAPAALREAPARFELPRGLVQESRCGVSFMRGGIVARERHAALS